MKEAFQYLHTILIVHIHCNIWYLFPHVPLERLPFYTLQSELRDTELPRLTLMIFNPVQVQLLTDGFTLNRLVPYPQIIKQEAN
jgi:hypothetical protein